MENRTTSLAIVLFIFAALALCNAIPTLEQEYKIEAFEKNGDSQTLVLKFVPVSKSKVSRVNRQGRQEEEEEESPNTNTLSLPSSTPFIPAVIPALTKIFTGIITGNLNEIIHGSSSFAPQNVSYAFDTVYNQIVGLPGPVSTEAPTRKPVVQATTEPEPAPVTPSPTKAAASLESSSPYKVAAGQPLQEQTVVITTSTKATTTKAASNEDDEDENDVEGLGFGFRRLRRKNGLRS